jgi:hypothetical protein
VVGLVWQVASGLTTCRGSDLGRRHGLRDRWRRLRDRWRRLRDRWRRLRDLRYRLGEMGRRLSDLLAAEPPVVFIRVVLPMIEAPIRRGFALSHIFMLSVSYSEASAVLRTLSSADSRALRRSGELTDVPADEISDPT